MGLKSIKKGIKSLKKLPKKVSNLPGQIEKLVTNGVLKKLGKPIMKTLKFFVKWFNFIRKPIMNIVKKIVSGFTFIFFYIKCGIKMLTNFYKCFIFYFLDIVKYLLIYVPVIVILHIIGMHSEWKQMKPSLDKGLQWPNSIQNNCYRCKNKKGEKIALLDTIKAMFEKEGVDDSPFNFFFFLLIMFVGFGFFYTIYHSYSSKNLVFDNKAMSLNIMRDIWLYAVILCIFVTMIYYQPEILISSSKTPLPGQYSQ